MKRTQPLCCCKGRTGSLLASLRICFAGLGVGRESLRNGVLAGLDERPILRVPRRAAWTARRQGVAASSHFANSAAREPCGGT